MPGDCLCEALNQKHLASVLLTLGLCVGLLAATAASQTPRKALTKNEVIELLESGVAPTRVAQLARQYGIGFDVTRETESQLLDAGASEDLLKSLQGLASRPTATSARPRQGPILMIESSLGGAHVYIDDEPMGTTSAAGRLRLSRLLAGEHRVRLSLSGYRDYEQTVSLQPGGALTVTATLEAAPATPASLAQPTASSDPLAQASDMGGGPATLGVALATTPPAGRAGVYIQDVLPDGPGHRAGLRPGHSILAVDGQDVSTPQQVAEIILGRRPDETVQITYSGGQTVQMTAARLVTRSSVPTPTTPGLPGAGMNALATAMTPSPGVASFTVAHDHGSGGSDYCMGVLVVGNGMVQFQSQIPVHSFQVPVGEVKEAKKNAVYLAALGGFHIRLKDKSNYNFVVLDSLGQPANPDAVLDVIQRAISGR